MLAALTDSPCESPPALLSTKIGGDSLFRIEKIRVFSELFLSRTGRTGCAGDGCEFAFEAGCERYSLAAANTAQAENPEDGKVFIFFQGSWSLDAHWPGST